MCGATQAWPNKYNLKRPRACRLAVEHFFEMHQTLSKPESYQMLSGLAEPLQGRLPIYHYHQFGYAIYRV